MSKFKGTKGKWLVRKDPLRVISSINNRIDEKTICRINPDPTFGYSLKEAEANAKLFEVAPDMLKALELFVYNFQKYHKSDDPENIFVPNYFRAVELIGKIKGE